MSLKIENLDSGYGELKVLNGIDIEVKPKEIVALIGPNGAGKSTVIKSVFNISKINDGKITFEGENLIGMQTHKLIEKGISYVNQGKIIFNDLSIRENLEIGVENKSKDEVNIRLDEIYRKFPALREREKDMAYGLSGGQRQQLALGRALMQKPKLLMLDEPSLGLSPKLQKEVFSDITKLRDEGLAILIVEQNAKKAIEIANRTYLLENGKVALSGGKEILKDKKIRRVYLGG